MMKMLTLHNGLHNKIGFCIVPICIGMYTIWHISNIDCAKFEVYTCSICDVMTLPINA